MIIPEEFYVAQNEAVASNERNASIWSTYKDDLKGTQALLMELPEKLSHNVMVPLGSRAMMRGKIVHTNEFLVSLGDSYFVKRTAKQSWSICERKINKCDEMLQNFEKEKALLNSRLKLPTDNEAFGSQDRPEIVEHMTEDEEVEWRKIHREREKEYRRKLAAVRESEKTKIKTEEDLWQRLDELELEEELEDELQRLHDGSSDEEREEEVLEDDSVEEVKVVENLKSAGDGQAKVTKRKKSVVFADDIVDLINEPVVLNFKHSDALPSVAHSQGKPTVVSPGDIFPRYLIELREAPSSILKVKKNPNKVKELASISSDDETDSDKTPVRVVRGLELPEIKERRYFEVQTVTDVSEQPKRMSKFKASRLKKNNVSGL